MLDYIWLKDYLGSVKPMTELNYSQHVHNHIKPALGAIKLDVLNAPMIQSFYNSLGKPQKGKEALSGKTIRCIHGILHKSLQQAVKVGYIRTNPTEACELPKVVRKEIKPLDSEAIISFLKVIEGHRFESLFILTLFTGLRRGEVCGLTWDCVDLDKGSIFVNKQLQNIPGEPGKFRLVSSKNGKGRYIALPASITTLLKRHKAHQNEERLRAGSLWEDSGFVFTDEVGHHLSPNTVYHNYKRVVESIGLPNARFHDLRHSYAVAAIQAGDDIKTVQGNLGHATAAFTLDVYAHVTDEMKKASADRMEKYIKDVSDL